MKNFIKIIFFTILIFSFDSCKKNKESKNFVSEEIKADNSSENEMLSFDEMKERLDLKNPEVKAYFRPFYDTLKKMDKKNPTPEDQIKLFYEKIKVLDKVYYFNFFDFDY